VYVDSSATRRDSIARICFSNVDCMKILVVHPDQLIGALPFIKHRRSYPVPDAVVFHAAPESPQPIDTALLEALQAHSIPVLLAALENTTRPARQPERLPHIHYADGLELSEKVAKYLLSEKRAQSAKHTPGD
jgi:hypothetical protein